MFKRTLVDKNVHITVLSGYCFTVFLIVQWIECPAGVREAMASILVGHSDFLFVPARVMLISLLFTCNRAY